MQRGNLPSARRGTEEASKHSSEEPGRSARRLQQVPVRAPTALMDTHRRFVRYLLRDWLPRLRRVTSCSLELERTNVESAVYFIIGVFEVHCTNCRPIRRSSPPPCTHGAQPLVGRIHSFTQMKVCAALSSSKTRDCVTPELLLLMLLLLHTATRYC
jgi:hypothetical protein